MQICLVEPEIPANTGNIARTCVVTNSPLHLCGHLGFSLEDKYLKRAGLDYWFQLQLQLWDQAEDCFRQHRGPIYYASSKAPRCYTEVAYHPNSLLVFGAETRGLPESMLLAHPERCIRIPMAPGQRSLNLSNSVAIVLYEALRQQNFPGLEQGSAYLKKL